jgi:beta-xylosidase
MNVRHLMTFAACLPILGFAQPHNVFGNALIPDMVADASIQLIGDTFYCYATTDGYGRGLETSGPPVVWKSKDFVHWCFNGTYFPSAALQKYWAPSKAIHANGRWYIYPTVNGIMHVAVSDSPDGPFRLARGRDVFDKPYAEKSTLLQGADRGGIDAEVFVDDDGAAYVFWGGRHVARLGKDMTTVSDMQTLQTRRTEYSEGPIFFKRHGIYYYLYTIGGDEQYEYYYMMSRTSPLGPYETPKNDLVTTTDVSKGVFGPGHGCVFNDGENYYMAYLEFGRGGTNRQTYVSRMDFNDDGTIRTVNVSLDGVGALHPMNRNRQLRPVALEASSTMSPQNLRYYKDERCRRTEWFSPDFATDGANGSRWMAQDGDSLCFLIADLGKSVDISQSEVYFVRPTAGHAYMLEGSDDKIHWTRCGGHDDVRMMSPHVDIVGKSFRYLRVSIKEGVKGIWEWHVFVKPDGQRKQASSAMARKGRMQSNILSDEPRWGEWTAWGEQTDGTYRNPLLPADFSDIDCIRVGRDYYAISSTMQFSPGMTVLHSRDLVNWEIASNAVTDLTQISSALGWREMNRYGRGVWAGTLRYHKGRFFLFFGTPDEGYFMTSATSAQGPWEPLTPLLKQPGWDDCTALWDKDGKAYFLGTCFKDGYKTYLFDMAPDGRSIDPASARLVNEGGHREANKLIHHGGYYYLIFSEYKPGVGRYVMAKRDRSMSGSFSEERQLLLPCVEDREPNQGGIVDARGKWYFLTHHGTGDWAGRVASLLPVTWIDGWPMMGDVSEGLPGKMVWHGRMPLSKGSMLQMQKGDDFDGTVSLGPQWQWNYQPRDSMYSLTERPGWLRMYAFRPLKENHLLAVGNILTQRTYRTPGSEVVMKMDVGHLADGQHAGLCHFSAASAALGVVSRDGKMYMEYRLNDSLQLGCAIDSKELWLKSAWSNDGLSSFSFSTDGQTFHPFGTYQLTWGYYRGDRVGLFSYNDRAEAGYVDVDFFHMK